MLRTLCVFLQHRSGAVVIVKDTSTHRDSEKAVLQAFSHISQSLHWRAALFEDAPSATEMYIEDVLCIPLTPSKLSHQAIALCKVVYLDPQQKTPWRHTLTSSIEVASFSPSSFSFLHERSTPGGSHRLAVCPGQAACRLPSNEHLP